jgi:hypothetical protein
VRLLPAPLQYDRDNKGGLNWNDIQEMIKGVSSVEWAAKAALIVCHLWSIVLQLAVCFVCV